MMQMIIWIFPETINSYINIGFTPSSIDCELDCVNGFLNCPLSEAAELHT